MLPKPVIHSGIVTVPAGGEVWLFTEVADIIREPGERVPVKVVLLSFSTTRDPDLWMQFYDVRDPMFEPFCTAGLPGLDNLVEPVAVTVHVGHELRCKAINRGVAAKDITYFFYLEKRREDNVYTRQYVFAGSPTLAPREDRYEAARIAVAPDEVGIVYRLAFDRNPSVRAFLELDTQTQPPTAGLNLGTLPGITRLVPVYYVAAGPEGDRELKVLLTNMSDVNQTVPYLVLAHVYKAKVAEKKPEETEATAAAGEAGGQGYAYRGGRG